MMIILNPSPYDDALDACDFGKIAMFLLNEIEGGQVTGETQTDRILERLREIYPEAKVVLTLGGEGSVYQYKEEQYRQGIYKVKGSRYDCGGGYLYRILYFVGDRWNAGAGWPGSGGKGICDRGVPPGGDCLHSAEG